MENNIFTETFVTPAPQAEAATPEVIVMQKSRAPVVMTMVCMFLAGAIAAGLLFFFSGRGGSYERAERSSLNAFASGFSSLLNLPESFSEAGSVTITPSRDLSSLPGMESFPDLGNIILNYEGIIEGGDSYVLLGLDALGINASFEMWQLGQELIMHFPGISDYYILLDYMQIYGMGDMSGLMEQFGDFDEDVFLAELKAIGEAVLDRYFEMTKDIKSGGTEEVTVGGLTQTADVYEVIIDQIFALELAITALDAFLDSSEFMRLCEAYYTYYMESYTWWSSSPIPSFESVVEDLYHDAFDELEILYEDGVDEDEFITMRVFISGRDVIKRDIIVEDFILSFGSIKEKNGEYAQNLRISATNTDWRGNVETTTILFENNGTTDRSGSTGALGFSYQDRWDSVSFEITYEDFKLHDNGTFDGIFNLVIPVEDTFSIELRVAAAADGNKQAIDCSLSVRGSMFGIDFTMMDALKIEIVSEFDTGKTMPRPNNNSANTLNSNDWRAMDRFEDDFYTWLYNLNVDLDFIEDLIYDLRWSAGSSGWDDWDDWDDWNDGDDWCSGDEWCWCDNCDNYGLCDDCDNWHWRHDDCVFPCEKCRNVKWFEPDEETFNFYKNYFKGYWKNLLVDEWDEDMWQEIIAEWEDCIVSFWFDNFIVIFAEYDIDVSRRYDQDDAVTRVWDYIYDSDGWGEYLDWSEEKWDEAWRNAFEA